AVARAEGLHGLFGGHWTRSTTSASAAMSSVGSRNVVIHGGRDCDRNGTSDHRTPNRCGSKGLNTESRSTGSADDHSGCRSRDPCHRVLKVASTSTTPVAAAKEAISVEVELVNRVLVDIVVRVG